MFACVYSMNNTNYLSLGIKDLKIQMVLIQSDKNVNRKISLLTYFLVISNNYCLEMNYIISYTL